MKNKKAFTLLEVLIAITLITVVFTAITGLILSTLSANRRNVHSLQATYLAQEGLEVMRYIRDSNWLQNYSWDEGEDQWGTNFSMQETSSFASGRITSGITITHKINEFYILEEDEEDAYWSLITVSSADEDDGLVSLANGQEFLRTIRIEEVPDETDPNLVRDEAWKVTALVSWEDRGSSNEVELSTILTNWQ